MTSMQSVGNFIVEGFEELVGGGLQIGDQRNDTIGDSYQGYCSVKARVTGAVIIPVNFIFAGASLTLQAEAFVDGGIEFKTDRAGSVGGQIELRISASIKGGFILEDAGEPGGLASKGIFVAACLGKSLRVRLLERANYNDWTISVIGNGSNGPQIHFQGPGISYRMIETEDEYVIEVAAS